MTGLIPGHLYQLSGDFSSVYLASPPQLSFTAATDGIPGTAIGAVLGISDIHNWHTFTGSVVVPFGVTSGTFAIENANDVVTGNDFALDNIVLEDVTSAVEGKATGGIKYTNGEDFEVQLDFVAMSKHGKAKGIVKYTDSSGVVWMGDVTSYYQNSDGTQAYFYGDITKKNNTGDDYFYVSVRDDGEPGIGVDAGVEVLTGTGFLLPSLGQSYLTTQGNVQIH